MDNRQSSNKIALVATYERAAFERASGARPATADEKTKAQQFLNDLRVYNESLPQRARILDANTRLISPAKMSAEQRALMEDIFSGETNEAGDRLAERMNAIYDKLANAAERQVKGL